MLFFLFFILNLSNSQVLENCIDKEKYKYEYFFNGTLHLAGIDIKLSIISDLESDIIIFVPHLNYYKKIRIKANENFEEIFRNYNQNFSQNWTANHQTSINGYFGSDFKIIKTGLFIYAENEIFANIVSECTNESNKQCVHFSSTNLISNFNSGKKYILSFPIKKNNLIRFNVYSFYNNNKIKYISNNHLYNKEFILNKGENTFISFRNSESNIISEIHSEFPISIIQDFTNGNELILTNRQHVIYSNNKLDNEYILLPFKFNNNNLFKGAYYFKITPIEDNTDIWINNDFKGTLNKNSNFLEYSDIPLNIRANKKISIKYFDQSVFQNNNLETNIPKGSFIHCLPTKQMSKYLKLFVSQNFDNISCLGNDSKNDSMYCNIIAFQDDSVFLDGKLIDDFIDIPGTNYKYKSQFVKLGYHTAFASRGLQGVIYGHKALLNNVYTHGIYCYNNISSFKRDDADILINDRMFREILCGNDPFILNADAPDEAETFHWTINDTLQTEGKEVDLYLPEPGEYNIKLKLDNDDEQIYEWTVTRLEKIATDLDSVVYLCNDSLSSIEMNVSGGGTSKSITWFPNENIKDPNDFNIQFIKPITETQTLYYEITDEQCCTFNDSVRIDITKVYPKITTTKTTFCEGDSATLSLDKEYEVIIWNTGEETQDIVVKESGVYSATVTEGNCTNDTSIVINVNPLPEIEIEAPDGTILCDGGSIEIEAKVPAGTQIQWENNSRLLKRTINQSGTYTITATNIATGCKSEKSIEVTDIDNIEAEIIGDTTFCDGESTTLTIQPKGESFLWNNGETTQSIEVNESGIYSATITTEAGCEVWAEKEVEKLPLPEFEILGEKIICDNEVEIYPDQDFEKYEWTFENNIISTEKVLTVIQAGDYELTITDGNGCKAIREVTIIENDPTLNLSSYNIDFGEIIFGEQRTETITADKEVILTKNTTLFNVAINSTQINITFNPDNIGTYEDYIIVESIGDCKASRTITITGICKAEILASVSNSEGYPGDNVSNQVSLELLQQIPLPIEFNYEITLSTNQDAIRITDATTFDYANGKLIIDLNNYIFKEEQKTDLDPINSKIMLAKNLDNPLEITHFTTDNEYLIPLRQNGNIKIYEICIYEERLIEYYNPAQIQKISKTEMKLSTYYAGKYEIEIADITGKTISKQSRTTNKDESIEFNYNLSNGTYIIKITEPGKTQTRKIVFVE